MLSLVSVYNNAAKLEARLQASLARQNRAHQLICVDNRSGRFGGAAAALNHGAAQAKGDWIVFLHQDVELLGNDWLEWDASIPTAGTASSAGPRAVAGADCCATATWYLASRSTNRSRSRPSTRSFSST